MKFENWHTGNDGRNRTQTSKRESISRQDYDSTNAPTGSVAVKITDWDGKKFTLWLTPEQLASAGYVKKES